MARQRGEMKFRLRGFNVEKDASLFSKSPQPPKSSRILSASDSARRYVGVRRRRRRNSTASQSFNGHDPSLVHPSTEFPKPRWGRRRLLLPSASEPANTVASGAPATLSDSEFASSPPPCANITSAAGGLALFRRSDRRLEGGRERRAIRACDRR